MARKTGNSSVKFSYKNGDGAEDARIRKGDKTRQVIEDMLDRDVSVLHRKFKNKREALSFANRYRRMSQRQEYPIECYGFGLDVYIVNLIVNDEIVTGIPKDNVFSGFIPTDRHLLNLQQKRNGIYYQTIKAFLASGAESAVKEYEDEASCKKAYIGFRALLMRRPDLDVCHIKDGNKIYLRRGRRPGQ